MNTKRISLSFFTVVIICSIFFPACNNSKQSPEKDIARSPQELTKKSIDHIEKLLSRANRNNGKIDDSTALQQLKPVQLIYKQTKHNTTWSKGEQWLPIGDSLLNFIENARLYGLFPEDYHYEQLFSIQKKFSNDAFAESDRKDASLWARADLMMTDAFVQIIKDIKLGRLPQDSIFMRTDSVLNDDACLQQWNILQQTGSLNQVIKVLEPRQEGYKLLKAGIKRFLDSFDHRSYTYVPSPSKDRTKYKQALQKRLYEGGLIETDSIPADSIHLAEGLKKFQEQKGIEVDGKIGNETLRMLNTSDSERFVRISITMDRYKTLPEKMPGKFLWVNLPAFALQLWENDSIRLTSKIICGKPATRSPVLTSAIAELITYPKWTIPASIIEKEVLPGLKRNSQYTVKKGFTIFDSKGNEVNPDSVDWSKYKKAIPYHVIQGSGDANALGVLKFNFSNKYAVYLHDTNERYLFARNDRAMSHGCIRVQQWQQLANYVVTNDEGNGTDNRIDSLQTWLKNKEKHSLTIHNKLPLFIRYFTCEGKDGRIVFYDDIYGEDRSLAEKYFRGKKD